LKNVIGRARLPSLAHDLQEICQEKGSMALAIKTRLMDAIIINGAEEFGN
jgi:hypothetical protein